jgi:hypothetical protein
MNTEFMERKFKAMGADLHVEMMTERTGRFWTAGRLVGAAPDGRPPYTVNVVSAKKTMHEYFEIRLNPSLRRSPGFRVLDTRPAERHLLLLARWVEADGAKSVDRFLCGHDERFWFAAAVPDRPSTVAEAMDALKPVAVLSSQASQRVKTKARNRRRNAVFVRQGEWFFLPAPDLLVPEALVLRREPIRRGRGKPHMLECAYRLRGTVVWVCPAYPNGLVAEKYHALVKRDPTRKNLAWSQMVRDATVYARGRVTHPDHKTVVLPGWHRVLPNREAESSATGGSLVFLD